MDKTTQNLIWSCLPHEYKKEVKRQYQIATNVKEYYTECTLEYLFGRHNLTSDAEGEEMLTCEKRKVQEQYALNVNALREGNLIDMQIEIATKVKDTLYYLFGSKCLPDEACNVASSDVASNVASSKPKPAEPKFTKEDMVHCKSFGYEGDYKVIEYVGGSSKCYDCIDRNGYHFRFYESDLEPYTEPTDFGREVNIPTEKQYRNLSQETANCDKCPKSVQKKHPGFGHSVVKDEMIDSIIKDSFREHNRLYIAAMAMQGIMANPNPQMVDMNIERIVDLAILTADTLIAECERIDKLQGE